MPHATHAYQFEAKVATLAGDLCSRFVGGESLRSFMLVLDQNGEVSALHFNDGSLDWIARRTELQDFALPYLFFDPLDDGEEYIWLEWKDVARTAMERLIGQRFDDSDFRPMAHFAERAPELNPPLQFPRSWRVMF
jgi:hypothetical protein